MNPWVALTIAVLAALYVIVAWVGLIYLIRKGLGPYFHSKRQHHTKVKAQIKHKIGHQDFHSVDWQVDTVRKVLVFECEDGIDRDYDVPDAVWDLSEQGEDGVLEYQGELFVEFHARRPHHDMNKAYNRLTRS